MSGAGSGNPEAHSLEYAEVFRAENDADTGGCLPQ